jgi:hypothetical protein
MHLPAGSPRVSGVQSKLEAAMLLKGVVRISLGGEQIEVQPRTWYNENGKRFVEVRRRDSGETMRVDVEQVEAVLPY